MRTLLLLLLLLVGLGCPPALTDDDDATGDDDDVTADDDDATGDDDDATGDDDDSTGDDDDSTGDDDDATGDDDDATGDDDDATGDDDSAAPTSCEDWSDDAILDVVYNGPKVPPGYFVDSYPGNEFPQWGPGCSSSLSDTQTAAAAQFTTGTLTGATRSEVEFYEVDVAINGGANTVHYRQTRCDWYDGTTLAGAVFVGWTELQWLAGYLWYSDNHNIGGHHILGGFGAVGGATNWFDLCHVTTVYGDWGLCDEVTLKSTGHAILQVQGDVTINPPVTHRTIQGNCN